MNPQNFVTDFLQILFKFMLLINLLQKPGSKNN